MESGRYRNLTSDEQELVRNAARVPMVSATMQ